MNTRFYRENKTTNRFYIYEMLKSNGSCIFLSGNSCTIYGNRPLICRFYPFTMFEENGYFFGIDKACKGVGLGEVIDKRLISKLIEQAKRSIGKPDLQ